MGFYSEIRAKDFKYLTEKGWKFANFRSVSQLEKAFDADERIICRGAHNGDAY